MYNNFIVTNGSNSWILDTVCICRENLLNVTVYRTFCTRDIKTALPLASSIQRDDRELVHREVVHMTGVDAIRSEGVVSLSDIGTVGTEDDCWFVLICHIVDEDRVPDIRNEREWRGP